MRLKLAFRGDLKGSTFKRNSWKCQLHPEMIFENILMSLFVAGEIY